MAEKSISKQLGNVKQCQTCGQWRARITGFYKSNPLKCKACIVAAKKSRQEENRAKITEEKTDNYKIWEGKRIINVEKAVRLHTMDGLNAEKISKLMGFASTSIRRCLKEQGVYVAMGKGQDPSVALTCEHCFDDFTRKKSLVDKSEKHFCSNKCYRDSLWNPDYKRSVYGCRVARKMIGGFIALPDGSIAHHKDGDSTNNNVGNLMLFRNQSDHIKWHRGTHHNVSPIFDGSSIG